MDAATGEASGCAPNGKEVIPRLDGIVMFLNAGSLTMKLASWQQKKEWRVSPKHIVYDLLRDGNGKAIGVKALIKKNRFRIRSRIVVGADGVETRVGKWAGIDTALLHSRYESCAQMTISGIKVEEDCLDFTLEMQLTQRILMGIPKRKEHCQCRYRNKCRRSKKKSAIKYLQEFVRVNIRILPY